MRAGTGIPQATQALAFDVVSIKPIAQGAPFPHAVGIWNRPDGLDVTYQNLVSLIQYAYGAKRFPLASQITGLPGWADTQRYDIIAKMSAQDVAAFQKLDKAGQQQWRETMARAMLADRFHLKVHQGTKPAPIFELVVGKGGIKMKDAATDPMPPLGRDADGKVPTRARDSADARVMQAWSMEALADFLSAPMTGLGRPVVDKTELGGSYDFTFGWSVYSPDTHRVEGAGWDSASTILRAVSELGLKLQPATGTLDTITVDHVEKASEN